MDKKKTAIIATANDEFRKNPHPSKGILVKTAALSLMGDEFFQKAWKAIQEFDSFSKDDNPWGERDFISVTIDSEKVFAKFDYFANSNMNEGTEDASLPTTWRVFTIMLAEDY